MLFIMMKIPTFWCRKKTVVCMTLQNLLTTAYAWPQLFRLPEGFITVWFDMLLMKDKLFAEYDTLQYLYLMESKDNMRDTYTGTSFNAHLMPVREVYDINSVQDWRTQKHTAGWTPENVLCIFPRKNLPNGAKLPVRNVSCAKKDRFPLGNFRLGWMRVSVDKFALPQNRRTIIVRLVINLL